MEVVFPQWLIQQRQTIGQFTKGWAAPSWNTRPTQLVRWSVGELQSAFKALTWRDMPPQALPLAQKGLK